MMEAANISETLVNFYQTTKHNIPEDSHPQLQNESSKATSNSSISIMKTIHSSQDSKITGYRLNNKGSVPSRENNFLVTHPDRPPSQCNAGTQGIQYLC
jgi:hypothetical protein